MRKLTERVGPQEAGLSLWSCALGGKARADGAVETCLRVDKFLNWIDMIQVGRRLRSLGFLVLCGFGLAFFCCLFLFF